MTAQVKAQTLFTYGKYSADAKDFIRAYNKNNTQVITNKERSIREYLDLYIKSRLKIREAYERGYDTLPQIKTETANLRTQIAENYMADPATTQRMAKEAFQRSQTDRHIYHIFISFHGPGGIDSATAFRKRDELMSRLQKGEDFSTLARQFSDDTSAKHNGGDLGFVTAFTLPYEFENVIYNAAIGKYTTPIQSKIGFHIFKVTEERKALGKIKLQQILLAFPPGIDEAGKKQIAKKTDSVYKRIMAGDNFNKMANDVSNDYVTAVNGGLMGEIGVGQYDPAFEKAVFALKKDGDVTKPFLTSHGWHIVKRVSAKKVVTDSTDKAYKAELEQKIVADNRWRFSKNFIYEKVKAKPGFRKYNYSDAALWNLSDSVMDFKPMTAEGKTITSNTPLFAIGDSVYNAQDWVTYASTYRYKQDGTGAKPWPEVREDWERTALINYYKDHLEDYNEDFKNQMTEFKEGNLFFEIMQQEIWNKAQSDSAALVALYDRNKGKYLWNQSADAILFFCSDMNTAKLVYDKVKANPLSWSKITEMYADKLVTDSARYEWDQIPNLNKMVPKKGMLTSPQLNIADNTASFAYIVNVYTQPTQRNFLEARGMVISDYQAMLEKTWDDALMKKYPVKVNEEVLKSLIK